MRQLYNAMHAELHGYDSDHNTAVHTIAQAMAAKQVLRDRDITVGILDKGMVLAADQAKTLRQMLIRRTMVLWL